MSALARLSLDLRPSLEIRLEAAKALYVECTEQLYTEHRSPKAPPDFNRWADLAYRASLAIYASEDADEPGAGRFPTPVKLTAWQLFEFLNEHGIDGHALVL